MKQDNNNTADSKGGFTKGNWKWEWDSDELHTGINIVSDNGEKIVDFVMGANLKEAEANALLIAQSPRMFAFIQEMAKRYENSEWIAKEANEIIKSATQQ